MKRTISVSSVWLAFLFIIISNDSSFSWEDKVTHKDLSKYASENSVLYKGYLSDIGFTKGLDDEKLELNGKKLSMKYWLLEGAALEDTGNWWNTAVGTARFVNHFHNPLKDWSNAGLTVIY